jgi:hypothetical protein
MTTRAETLDDALERLAGYAYLDGFGFACHGPMGAEALSTLGYDDRVSAWVEAYKATHAPIAAPPRSERLDGNDAASWRPALGDYSRVSDWALLFAHELRGQPWQDVLRRWAPRLLAGCAGGLTHGLIRTAHAVRAIPSEGAPSDLGLDELAKGLALWAGMFQTLPGRPSLRGSLTLHEAVARLPRPAEPWAPIEAGTFARLDELEDFHDAVEALAPPKPDEDPLSDLTAEFSRVILANPDVMPVGLVHAVTSAAAARTLLPYLTEVPIDVAYAHLWHTSAAIAVGFTPPPTGGQPPLDAHDAPTPADVRARAAEHRDPHVVKFTEACARENALHPDPVYMLAAQHVLEHTPTM